MKHNTIILFWNPAISSYTLERFEEEYPYLCLPSTGFNWSVWDHETARKGDTFYMVRCKKELVNGEWQPAVDDTCGICMKGKFTSDPYEGEDWSGKGRRTFYMDMNIDFAVHPDRTDMITVAELMEKIPGFDWTGGHSGRVLDEDKAKVLKKLYNDWQAGKEIP